MSITSIAKNKAKGKLKKQAKKLVFKVIKPFLPFILIILGIVFAVCTVADSLFTTDEDMQVAEQLANDNYEEQYAQWLQEKENSPTTITNGTGLVSKRYVYLANSWLYNYYFSFWHENTSNNSCL